VSAFLLLRLQPVRIFKVTGIAKIAQDAGIQMLSIHGRTKEDKYKGEAEYDTIASVVSQVEIPVIANGQRICFLAIRTPSPSP
jgi:tRNA-dihydrouridine synthase B